MDQYNNYDKLDNFLGNWILETNKNLEEFLKFYEYSWFSMKAALLANVELIFKKTEIKNSIERTVNSTFLKGTELYTFDQQFHLNPENLKKKHILKTDTSGNSIIQSVILKNDNNLIIWHEEAKILNDKLIITRYWNVGNSKYDCQQIFKKKS
jgi:hypothetical protein